MHHKTIYVILLMSLAIQSIVLASGIISSNTPQESKTYDYDVTSYLKLTKDQEIKSILIKEKWINDATLCAEQIIQKAKLVDPKTGKLFDWKTGQPIKLGDQYISNPVTQAKSLLLHCKNNNLQGIPQPILYDLYDIAEGKALRNDTSY